MVFLWVILITGVHLSAGSDACKTTVGYGADTTNGNRSFSCLENWIDAAHLSPPCVFSCIEKCSETHPECLENTTCALNVTYFKDTGVCLCSDGYSRSPIGRCIANESISTTGSMLPHTPSHSPSSLPSTVSTYSPTESQLNLEDSQPSPSANESISTTGSMLPHTPSHSPSSLPSTVSTYSPTESQLNLEDSQPSPSAAIIGLSVGIAVGLLLFIVLILLFTQRRRRRKRLRGSGNPNSTWNDLHARNTGHSEELNAYGHIEENERRAHNSAALTGPLGYEVGVRANHGTTQSENILTQIHPGNRGEFRNSDTSTASWMYSNHQIAKNRDDNKESTQSDIPNEYNTLYAMGKVSTSQNGSCIQPGGEYFERVGGHTCRLDDDGYCLGRQIDGQKQSDVSNDKQLSDSQYDILNISKAAAEKL